MVCWHEIFDRNENSVSCLPVTSQSRDSDASDIQMNTLMKLIVFYLSSIKAPSGETVGTQQIECRKRRNKYWIPGYAKFRYIFHHKPASVGYLLRWLSHVHFPALKRVHLCFECLLFLSVICHCTYWKLRWLDSVVNCAFSCRKTLLLG